MNIQTPSDFQAPCYLPMCLNDEDTYEAIPNPIQNSIRQAAGSLMSLCTELEISLPAHEKLIEHVFQGLPVLPAVVPKDVESVLLSTLAEIYKTRISLHSLWLFRCAEADGVWFDGHNYTGEMPVEDWLASPQYIKHEARRAREAAGIAFISE